MNTKKRVVLISAEKSDLSAAENQNRTSSLENALKTKNYQFSQILGCYSGTFEKSFLVDASEDILKHLLGLAGYFNQESILVVNENQSSILHHTSGKTEKLGTMRQVNSLNGEKNWSLVNGLFYVVK